MESNKRPPKAMELMSTARNFMASRILLTGAELNVYTLLAQPKTASELVDETGWYQRPTVMLLDALTALGALVKDQGYYRTDPDLAEYLKDDSPRSILPSMLHMNGLWDRWSRLTSIVKDTGVPETPSSVTRSPKSLKAFIGAMAVVAEPQAVEIVKIVDPGSAASLLDIGGGPGVYTMAFLKASSGIRATLFDKPDVVEIARERLEREGLLARVDLTPGDYYKDELPAGHDIALLSAIIHSNSPAENLDLYQKTYRALNPGGRIIIRDHVMAADRTSPVGGSLFAINMLVNTTGGGTYTFEEIESGLKEAGFTNVVLLHNDERMNGLVEAFKPL